VNPFTVEVVIVVPAIVPPVMATVLAFCWLIVPRLPVAAVRADVTNCVLAIWLVLVPDTAVGAVGVPVKAALANMVLLLSLVTLPKPTLAAVSVSHEGLV
jgi:hypothetical protein